MIEYSYLVPNSAVSGAGPILRQPKSKDELVEKLHGIRSTHDIWLRGVRLSGHNNCMGTRSVEENDGPYEWISYNQAHTRVKNIGCGLMHQQLLQPQTPINNLNETKSQCFLGIYSVNCAEWVLCEQAANAFSICVVPLYDTLGMEACTFIMNHMGLEVVACSQNNVMALLQCHTPSLKTIIYWHHPSDEEIEVAATKGISLLSLSELEKIGKDHPREFVAPSAEMLATICYTSGTTGNPKGAMLTHRNLIADVTGVLSTGFTLRRDDVHLSYLPLAHMFERIVQLQVWCVGAQVGFYRGNVQLLMEDVCELRPTIFPSVPRLFNRLYDKVMNAVNEQGGLKAMLFHQAYEAKKQNLAAGYYTHVFWDAIVFRNIQAKLGGRVRLMVTGSAPIAAHVLEFLRICFSCPVHEGYGQTECGAAATLTVADDTSTGHVGGPIGCNEIRLFDVVEMGYTSAVDPPRGEVCYRGPNCFPGYFKDLENSKAALDAEGWLHSGDIGQLLPNGAIRIIDRKKHIFKLSQGEYVSPERVESVYTRAPLVAQCFAHGDSLESFLVGVVIPDIEVARQWTAANLSDEERNGQEITLEWLCKNDKFKEAVLKSMAEEAKKAGLKGFETLYAVHIDSQLFSVENDLLTPTFKLKRAQALAKYKTQLHRMYGK